MNAIFYALVFLYDVALIYWGRRLMIRRYSQALSPQTGFGIKSISMVVVGQDAYRKGQIVLVLGCVLLIVAITDAIFSHEFSLAIFIAVLIINGIVSNNGAMTGAEMKLMPPKLPANAELQRLDLSDQATVERILAIQQAGYAIEAQLIDFDDIPPLHETMEDIQHTHETFIGYLIAGILAGVASYEIEGDTLDICRLVVHPEYFRRGIARALVAYMENCSTEVSRLIVSTGAKNTPARTLYEQLGYDFIRVIKLPEGVSIAKYRKSFQERP